MGLPLPHGLAMKYHLTRCVHVPRIKYTGLKVDHDARKVGRIWLCDLSEVDWVAEHLTIRDHVTLAQWAMFAVDVRLLSQLPKKCGQKGIYYCTVDIPPSALRLEASLWVDLHDGPLPDVCPS